MTCPFCRFKETSVHKEHSRKFYVRCSACKARGPTAPTAEQAKKLWMAVMTAETKEP